MQLGKWERDIFFATVRIRSIWLHCPDHGKSVSIGTGFMVGVPHPTRPEINLEILVTARHVIHDGRGTSTLFFCRRDQADETRPALGPALEVDGDFGDDYYGHDDPEVDLAAVDLTRGLHRNRNAIATLIDLRTPARLDELDAGAEVQFVGYPAGRYDHAHNLPILRTGTIASIPSVPFDGRRAFLIDAHVLPGSSGSPVFATVGRTRAFVGVIVESFARGTVVELMEEQVAKKQKGVFDFIGIGLVVHRDAVIELIGKVVEAVEAKEAIVPPTTGNH